MTEARNARIYSWIALFFAWLIFMISYGDRLIWANVSGAAGDALHLSVAALGSVATAFSIGYVFGNGLAGFAVDRWGIRISTVCLIVPLGCFTAGFGLSHHVAQAYAFQILMGLTAGVAFIGGVKVITASFPPQKRMTAMGLFLTATSIAVTATNAIIPRLLGHHDWRHIYFAAGALTAVLGALAWFVFREGAGRSAVGRPAHNGWHLFRYPAFWWLTVANCGGPWATWGFALWANILLVHRFHLTPTAAGSIVASFGIGAIFAKPIVGIIADASGRYRKAMAIAIYAIFGALVLTFGLLSDLSHFQIIAPVLGLFGFIYAPLISTMIAEFGGNALSGSASGLTQVANTSVGALQPLVVGLVYQFTNSFFLVFLTLALGPFLSAVSLILYRPNANKMMSANTV